MSGFGFRKNNTGKAIIRFLIGLLLVAVCVLLLYELVLKGDFTKDNQKVDNAQPLTSAAPTPTLLVDQPFVPADANNGDEDTATKGEASENEPVNADENEPSATEMEPSETEPPTEPEPAYTPETVVPEATPIPAENLSKENVSYGSRGVQMKKTGFEINRKKINIGITEYDIPDSNNGQVLTFTGWAFAEDTRFDGAKAKVHIIVLNSKNGAVFYDPIIVSGATGIVHEGKGKNLDQTEFMAAIDVSWYPDGVYQLGAGVAYKPGSTTYKYAYTFGESYSFTVVDGVITAIGGMEVS